MRPCIKELMLLSKYVEPKDIRWLISTWLINHAFADYRDQRYSVVPQGVVQAIITSPGHAFNPGVASILFKSLIYIIKSHFPGKLNKLSRLNNSQV
jgi:hypothetical protein